MSKIARVVGILAFVIGAIALFNQYSFNANLDLGFFDALTAKNLFFSWLLLPSGAVAAVIGLLVGIWLWGKGDKWPFLINAASILMYALLLLYL